MSIRYLRFAAMCTFGAASAAQAQWVNFVNETSTRLPAALNTPATSTNDTQEKDYAWGDLDHDGDIDLVVVRKQPFTTAGKQANVLFMNEGIAQGHAINGVLVDRTAQYATAVDVNGDGITDTGAGIDLGFNQPTNDRDVVLGDVNGDTWLDIITCTTISDGDPKHIGHPRIYINRGEVGGAWQGFRFENARFPQLLSINGIVQNPRFCSVAVGDVTGDGYPDLYFGDYDSSGAGGASEPGGDNYDMDNRLLINQGAANPGYFVDQSTARMGPYNGPMLDSAFGAASVICDMNNDGKNDVVKQTSLQFPQHIAIAYNNPANVGHFINYTTVPSNPAPYFVSAGDLNNDGRLDLVETDDNDDRYQINLGWNAQGVASFAVSIFQPGGIDDGFGSQSVIEDLDNDGWRDVVISDVDVDIGPCGGRRMHIYHNLLGDSNPATGIVEEPVGGLGPNFSNLSGTHNVAVFDLNQDGRNDLVIGRCSTTTVWINQPVGILNFSYPQGLPPSVIEPDTAHTFQVQLTGASGGTPMAGSGRLHYSIDGGAFAQVSMTSLGGNLYEATLPAEPCGTSIRWYVRGLLTNGSVFTDPAGAPAVFRSTMVADDVAVTLSDDIEGKVTSWTVQNDPSLTGGAWEPADPVGTINNGVQAAPEDDNTPAPGIRAFVTQNGAVGGGVGVADVDGGPTHLLSPTIDLAGSNASIAYARWFYTSAPGDNLTIAVSNDNGATWTTVQNVASTSNGTNTVWQNASFVVSDYVVPTSQVRVRFTTADVAPTGVVEAAIDDFRVDELVCGAPCIADIVGNDGVVNVNDLLAVVGAWGATGPNVADINGDLIVNVNDLLAVVGAWGPCP